MTMWQPFSAAIIGVVMLVGLYGYRLGSLIGPATAGEQQAASQSASLHMIINNPVNAPYKIAVYLVHKFNDAVVYQRLISGLVAVIAVVLFYNFVSRMYGRYSGVLGSLLFASSAVMLQAGRRGEPTVMLLTLLVLITCGFWLRFGSHANSTWLVSCLMLGLSLYVPGMVFFVLAGLAWQYKALKKSPNTPKTPTLVFCTLIILACMAPIAYSLFQTPSLWHEYLGLPAKMPEIKSILSSVAYVPLSVLALSPANPAYWLGRQPVLDIFSGGMLVLGCYAVIKKYRLDRTILLAGVFIVSTIWIGLSTNHQNLLVIIPFAYFLVTAGIAYLLREWAKVFPRNPLARSLSVVLMTVAVLLAANFQIYRYFIAWPKSPATRAALSSQAK